jgi:hypothetical protein
MMRMMMLLRNNKAGTCLLDCQIQWLGSSDDDDDDDDEEVEQQQQ